eukprot:m.213989 g.213989  ORF g.213989 m.213989 type:complete len:160 (+) comp31134_c0_seq1:16-495(+)
MAASGSAGAEAASAEEEAFLRFRRHDFARDGVFQQGLSDVTAARGALSSHDLLRLKALFYNRHVEPLDLASYTAWYRQHGLSPDDSQSQDGEGASRNLNSQSAAEVTSTKRLSLAEIMAYVQRGEPVPGSRIVDVAVASDMEFSQTNVAEAPRKPWEKA